MWAANGCAPGWLAPTAAERGDISACHRGRNVLYCLHKCGHRTSASITAFQAVEVGSIPIARSRKSPGKQQFSRAFPFALQHIAPHYRFLSGLPCKIEAKRASTAPDTCCFSPDRACPYTPKVSMLAECPTRLFTIPSGSCFDTSIYATAAGKPERSHTWQKLYNRNPPSRRHSRRSSAPSPSPR